MTTLRYSLPLAQAADPEGCAEWEARCEAFEAAFEAEAERIAAAHNYNPFTLGFHGDRRAFGSLAVSLGHELPLYRRAEVIASAKRRASCGGTDSGWGFSQHTCSQR